MEIDNLRNPTIILNVSGCTWLEFDSWTCSGSHTADNGNGYTYKAHSYIKEYNYATSTAGNTLTTEEGYETKLAVSENKTSLSNQKINVEGIDYVQISSFCAVGNTVFGTINITGIKGY